MNFLIGEVDGTVYPSSTIPCGFFVSLGFSSGCGCDAWRVRLSLTPTFRGEYIPLVLELVDELYVFTVPDVIELFAE